MYNKLIETTDWGEHPAPNFIYYTSQRNTRLHGYQREEGGEFLPFNSNLFSTRGRSFKTEKVSELPK